MREEFDWGDAVPVDIFVFGIGEPDNRFATKIGGLPYRPASSRWPTTLNGRPMALIAQFNFTQSLDLVGKLPRDLLLIFGDDSGGEVEPLYCEWQPLVPMDLVMGLPQGLMAVTPCFGYRCRTVSFPNATEILSDNIRVQWDGREVQSCYWLPTYQAVQIGRAPFFIHPGDSDFPGSPLCTVSSMAPDLFKPYPWVNRPKPICLESEWPPPHDPALLSIGDTGCIYVFIEDDGKVHAGQSCY